MAFRATILTGMVAAVLGGSAAFAQVAAPSVPATVPAPVAETPAQAPARADYLVGQGDILDIALVGQEDYRARVTVQADGTIQLPFLGTVRAQDKTLLALGAEIASGLEKGGYYVKPAVQVTLGQIASRYVTVLGAVGTPGLIPVERAYRVSEIMARVGGIKPDGGETFYLRREKGEEIPLTLEGIARGGDGSDPVVAAGDKIFVPTAPTYYVYGQVNAPGTYPIKNGMTLRMALARGGGLTALGSPGRVSIFRKGVELKKFNMSDVIQADDVIEVGERFF